MKLNRPVGALLLLMFVLVGSCDILSPTGHGSGASDTHFPHAVGVLWKYQVYDSLSQSTDTVWYSITDHTTIGSGKFITVLREKHFRENLFGWQYLHFSGDTLEFLPDTTGTSANERIVFPLELDHSWTGPAAPDDSSKVTQVGPIEVPAARFDKGARIDRSWNRDIEGGGNWSRTWVVSGVGVVYRYIRSQFSDGSTITVTKNEVWQLIEYDLTTFGLLQFPDKVGSRWIYEEVDSTDTGGDSLVPTFDTVTVTITRSGHFQSGEPYSLWTYVSSSAIDSQFVVIGNGQVRFQHDTIFSPLWDVYYDFPLAVGRTWGIEYFAPVPEVLDKETLSTPAQTFASSFHTTLSGGGFNDYWTQEDWLVPGVGIAKSRRGQTGFWPWLRRTRTLIDYQPAR